MKTTLDTLKLKVTGNPAVANVLDSLLENNPDIRLIQKSNLSDEVELYVLEFSRADYEKVLQVVRDQGSNKANYLFYSIEFSTDNPDKPLKKPRAA